MGGGETVKILYQVQAISKRLKHSMTRYQNTNIVSIINSEYLVAPNSHKSVQ